MAASESTDADRESKVCVRPARSRAGRGEREGTTLPPPLSSSSESEESLAVLSSSVLGSFRDFSVRLRFRGALMSVLALFDTSDASDVRQRLGLRAPSAVFSPGVALVISRDELAMFSSFTSETFHEFCPLMKDGNEVDMTVSGSARAS